MAFSKNELYIQYLEELIRFKSLTPLSAGCIEYVNHLLTQNGFKTEIKIFGEDYHVTNLYATYGTTRPNICFAGHVDVVPTGDPALWYNDPFLATTINNKIYGRGVVDMKGALACFLSASLDFIKLHPNPNGSVSFLITSDEEGEGKHGILEMLQYLYDINTHNKIDFAIVGEPTNEHEVGDTIKIGRRGSINFQLTLSGTQGHVAYPKQANNPIPGLIQIMYDFVNCELDKASQFFQPSYLEITSIDVGNKTSNIIPQEISARFNIRFNDLHLPDNIVNLIKQIIAKYCTQYGLQYKLDSRISAHSFIQKPIGLIADFAQIVMDTTKLKSTFSTSGGTSDARFIKNYCPVVEFGLLSATAHKINEYTTITDLQKLYHVYYNSLMKFLG